MNILLVYPRYPDTFWSFKHALKFISKKAAYPSSGTADRGVICSRRDWKKKLVDMNTDNLKDDDIAWADYVFLSAMGVQQQSAREVIRRCNQLHTKIVAGGPLFATNYEEFEGVDHFVLGEAETIVASLVTDLENGSAQHIYRSEERPDVRNSPGPAWNLIDTRKYATPEHPVLTWLSLRLRLLQYSPTQRPCPQDQGHEAADRGNGGHLPPGLAQ